MTSGIGKHAGGRPTKLNPRLALKIFFLARRGFTEGEIAQVLDIGKKSIQNWKKLPEFLLPLKGAKEEADSLVERSLFERAIGYNHKETKVFCHNGKLLKAEVTKHIPPDTVSCIFWLKNRKPSEWRDRIPELSNINDSVTSVLQLIRCHREENGQQEGPP